MRSRYLTGTSPSVRLGGGVARQATRRSSRRSHHRIGQVFGGVARATRNRPPRCTRRRPVRPSRWRASPDAARGASWPSSMRTRGLPGRGPRARPRARRDAAAWTHGDHRPRFTGSRLQQRAIHPFPLGQSAPDVRKQAEKAPAAASIAAKRPAREQEPRAGTRSSPVHAARARRCCPFVARDWKDEGFLLTHNL